MSADGWNHDRDTAPAVRDTDLAQIEHLLRSLATDKIEVRPLRERLLQSAAQHQRRQQIRRWSLGAGLGLTAAAVVFLVCGPSLAVRPAAGPEAQFAAEHGGHADPSAMHVAPTHEAERSDQGAVMQPQSITLWRMPDNVEWNEVEELQSGRAVQSRQFRGLFRSRSADRAS